RRPEHASSNFIIGAACYCHVSRCGMLKPSVLLTFLSWAVAIQEARQRIHRGRADLGLRSVGQADRDNRSSGVRCNLSSEARTARLSSFPRVRCFTPCVPETPVDRSASAAIVLLFGLEHF